MLFSNDSFHGTKTAPAGHGWQGIRGGRRSGCSAAQSDFTLLFFI